MGRTFSHYAWLIIRGKNVQSQKYSNGIQRGSPSSPNYKDKNFPTRENMFFLFLSTFYYHFWCYDLEWLSFSSPWDFSPGVLGYMKCLDSLTPWHISGHNLFWFLTSVWQNRAKVKESIGRSVSIVVKLKAKERSPCYPGLRSSSLDWLLPTLKRWFYFATVKFERERVEE